MNLIKKTSFCIGLSLLSLGGGYSAFAQNLNTTHIHKTDTHEPLSFVNLLQSPMTLASTDFSFGLLEEPEARLLIRGRKSLRARRVSLSR